MAQNEANQRILGHIDLIKLMLVQFFCEADHLIHHFERPKIPEGMFHLWPEIATSSIDPGHSAKQPSCGKKQGV